MLPARYPTQAGMTGSMRRWPPSPEGGPPGRVAFWLLAFVFAATMLGTTLPTPLYDIYQAQWHFSAAMVTVIFAVYAAAVLATLLLAGRSSDQAGRKPVLAAALGVSALSTVAFIFAPDEGVLLVGRVLSGLSAGLMTGTATATLTELVPARPRRASLAATAATWAASASARSSPGCSPSTRLTLRPWCSRCTWRSWPPRACACCSFPKRSAHVAAYLALRRPWHPRAGPGPVHRRRRGRVRRLRPARAVQFPGTRIHRSVCTRTATPSRAPSCSACSR